MKKEKTQSFYLSSPLGLLEGCMRGERLISLSKSSGKLKPAQSSDLTGQIEDQLQAYFQDQLQAYFQDQLQKFVIPLALEGTEKQKRVWKALQNIPYGKTMTYKEIALKVKIPKGARFIGQCCAKNPCLIVIPCHRVLSQKDIGGFALGLKAKRKLLSIESRSIREQTKL